MTTKIQFKPSSAFRKALQERGGETVSRCYQCATCSSVCELAPEGSPFPRRQMLNAQWGLEEQVFSDSAVWLCHQCNDCTVRCPRDAKPGDVMQALRSLTIQNYATPKFLGKLVGQPGKTWPLLIGLPILFWTAFIFAVTGFATPKIEEINGAMTFGWDQYVPHWMIYVTIGPIALWVVCAMFLSGKRFWNSMGQGVQRSGSFVACLVRAISEILVHRRFGSCQAAKPRQIGHLLFFFGFIGAAFTTVAVAAAMYGFKVLIPMPLTHWVKIVGNVSALLLLVGGLDLLINRMRGGYTSGRSTAFDLFFLLVIVTTGVTGGLTEVARLFLEPGVAVWFYVAHLAFITCLFATFPYCKFAHIIYRTLAMVHEMMAVESAEKDK
jgi:quinone-modifying oxidoreductase, subunit QmoC